MSYEFERFRKLPGIRKMDENLQRRYFLHHQSNQILEKSYLGNSSVSSSSSAGGSKTQPSSNDGGGSGLSLSLDASVLLLGAIYDEGNATMSTGLLSNDVIPTNQPYNTSPWNYTGSESVGTFPDNTVDWIIVQLRRGSTPDVATTRVDTQACLLLNDGTIVNTSGNTPQFSVDSYDNLYLTIYHRNHMPIISATSLSISGTGTSYDFLNGSPTTSVTGTGSYGELSQDLDFDATGTVYGMIPGDINGDGEVTTADSTLESAISSGGPTYSLFDVTLNAFEGTAGDSATMFNNIDFYVQYVPDLFPVI